MQIFSLEADTRLAKQYEKVDGELQVTPYPMVSPFTSHVHEVETIEDMYEVVNNCSDDPYRCLVKGVLHRTLKQESRRGSTRATTPTQWLCLDFDYIDIQSEQQLDKLLAEMGLGNVSYVLQYGAGHRITKSFSAHAFFLLDSPVKPTQLKTWLMERNLSVTPLKNALALQRTECSLKWPLDVTLAQNDKLIYTASPKCSGFIAPISKRVQLCKRGSDVAEISAEIEALTPGPIDTLAAKETNRLRKDKGLSAKTLKTRKLGNLEIATNPDRSTVTSVKNERGFTYINLNGGDSWGYYFPQDNPEIVFNFKGEPNYKLKDLDQEFYDEYKKTLESSAASGDGQPQAFAFLDRQTDKYYRGFYHPANDSLEIYPTGQLKKLQDFAQQSGLFLGDYVEEWDYEFRFDSDVVFSRQEKFVNRFRRTPFLTRSIDDAENIPHKIPPTIAKVLYSVVGDDPDVLIHFLNWCGVIVQHRQRTQTAWVFNGREGTGKGVLFNYILAPIIGADYCRTVRLSSLDDLSNAFMEDCVLLMIDEAKTSQLKNPEKAMAALKNAIVEPKIAIRRMHTDLYNAKNYMNVIVTSNHPDAIYISPTDRRFNVGVYQTEKLHLTREDIEVIGEELWDFAKILRTMNTDIEKAKTPLENNARERMMYLTETSISVAARALLQGNLEFFIDCLPTDESAYATSVPQQLSLDRYADVLREAEASAAKGEPMRVTRDQAQVLMEFAIDDVPRSANKFSNFMKHYGIFFKRMRKNSKTPPCVEVNWKPSTYKVDDCLSSGPSSDNTVNPLKAIK